VEQIKEHGSLEQEQQQRDLDLSVK